MEYRAAKLLPPPPLPLRVCPPPAPKAGGGGGYTLSPGSEGVGVSILEDARHLIGLLQYNPFTLYCIF